MANMRFTRLMAVNRILRGAGEQPVNSLTEDGINDTVLAESILDECTAEYQKDGLHTNTEMVTYSPDSEGFITLPSGTLRVDAQRFDLNVTQRGYQPTKLYDIDNRTFVFTKSIDLVITVAIPLEDLPIDIQFAVIDRAARMYQMVTVGDQKMDALLAEQEMRSRIAARIADDDQGDYNLFNNMNTSAYWAVNRIRKPSRRYDGLLDHG